MTVSPLLRSFLEPDNQTLLWSIISKHELFQQVLTEPEIWFQSILEMFFIQTQTQTQTQNSNYIETEFKTLYDKLVSLNKQTLLYMMQDLQKRNSAFSRNQMPIHSQNKSKTVADIVEQESKMIFAVEKDEPIKNLEERILEQQQLREKQDYILQNKQNITEKTA